MSSEEMPHGGITKEISSAACSRSWEQCPGRPNGDVGPSPLLQPGSRSAVQSLAGGRSTAYFFQSVCSAQRKNCASRATRFKWQHLHFWDSSSEKCSALISLHVRCFQGYWVLFTFTFRPSCLTRRYRLFHSSAENKPHKAFLTFPCKYWPFLAYP